MSSSKALLTARCRMVDEALLSYQQFLRARQPLCVHWAPPTAQGQSSPHAAFNDLLRQLPEPATMAAEEQLAAEAARAEAAEKSAAGEKRGREAAEQRARHAQMVDAQSREEGDPTSPGLSKRSRLAPRCTADDVHAKVQELAERCPRAVALPPVRLASGLQVSHLVYKHTGMGSETGFDLCEGVEAGDEHAMEAACKLMEAAASARREWRGSTVVPLAHHDVCGEVDASSGPARLGAAVASGCRGAFRCDLLQHQPHASVRTTATADRWAVVGGKYAASGIGERLGVARGASAHVILVDDCLDTGATAESAAAALRDAARADGIELTVEVAVLGLCTKSTDHVANEHLGAAVREMIVAALDADDTAGEEPLPEGEQLGITYLLLHYGGSTVRDKYKASKGYTGERCASTRGGEHNELKSAPKLVAGQKAHREKHGVLPSMQVFEVLRSRAGETWSAFKRRVIRAEQLLIDALFELGVAMNASRTAGRPCSECCARGGARAGRGGIARERCEERQRLEALEEPSEEEADRLVGLQATEAEDTRKWNDNLLAKERGGRGGSTRERCEERQRLEAMPSRTAAQEAELAALGASADADAQAFAASRGYTKEEFATGLVGNSVSTQYDRADPEKRKAQQKESRRKRKLTPAERVAEAKENLSKATTDAEKNKLKGILTKLEIKLGFRQGL